ncbi:hypothetical protein AB0M38_32505 [Streptomyces sp. NPDC051742]|uniref:hypothetical protein n=1 Tax=unclassified Streptomyces TaxID=2593676 RepID=UPI00343DB249
MDQENPSPRLLRDVYPALVRQLVRLLESEGERELAIVVHDVRMYGPCGCSDDFCQSIRTSGHPQGQPYGEGHRCVPLLPEDGMLNLDVLNGRIAFIEILDQPPLVPAESDYIGDDLGDGDGAPIPTP